MTSYLLQAATERLEPLFEQINFAGVTFDLSDLEFHSRGDGSVQRVVIGPLGFPITLADLPRPGTLRWVARRKAEIVAAVEGGLMSRESACAMYALSSDEFLSWQRSLARDGLAGLRIQSERKRRR